MDNQEESFEDSTIFQSCYDLAQQLDMEKQQAQQENNQLKFQELKEKNSQEQKLKEQEQKIKELEFLEQKYKVLESKYIYSKQQQEASEQKLKEFNKKFKEQEQKFKEQENIQNQLQQRHNECVYELQNLKCNYKQQESNTKEQQQKYNILEKQHSALKQEHYQLGQTYNILEQKFDKSQQNYTDLEQKLNQSEKKFYQLQQKYDEQEQNLKELENQIQKYQGQEQSHQQLEQEYKNQEKNLLLKFADSQQKLKEFEQKYYELEQKYMKDCEDKNYYFKQIEQLKQELNEKNKAIDELQNIQEKIKQETSNQKIDYTSNINKSQIFEITEDDELEAIEDSKFQTNSQQSESKAMIFQKFYDLPSQFRKSKDFLYQLIQQFLNSSDKGKSFIDDDIIIVDKIENQFPISILIGQDDIAKLKIMNLLFQNKKTKLFTFYEQQELKRNIVNTDAFEFEDIEEREQQIVKYQQLFLKYPNRIGNIFIVVKFERTDIMKKNILDIYKYFKKFQELISLIISDFHYSENQEKDTGELEQALQYFQFRKIFYFQNTTTKNQFIEELQVLKNELVVIDLSDTIFQPINLKYQQEIISQFPKY